MSVKDRERNGKLYLDIYANGQRKWESLGLTVSIDDHQNKEVMRLAEKIRSKREIQIATEKWDLNKEGVE